MGKFEDWNSDLSGGGVFGDWKYFSFDFAVVDQPDDGYFEDEMEFEGGCFEEKMEFGRMQKHIGDFW